MPHPLENAIPDPDALVAMEPEEVGAKLLFIIRANPDYNREAGVTLTGFLAGLRGHGMGAPSIYGGHCTAEVVLAVREAWAWLEAQGLLIPSESINGQNGWRQLSRRARRFENEEAFVGFALARLLPKENLHPAIAEPVWLDFMRGDFDNAVFRAMKAVEVQLRDAAKPPRDEVGVKLARFAFRPEDGPLTDLEAEGGEKDATMNLFAGAMGAFKNPQAHRDVRLDDPVDAASIIMFASYLLRVIDARYERLTAK